MTAADWAAVLVLLPLVLVFAYWCLTVLDWLGERWHP